MPQLPQDRRPEAPPGSPGERWARPWAIVRRLSRRQWLYLPRLFSRQERIQAAVAIAIAAIALSALTLRMIERVTLKRPAVAGTFREGMIREPRFVNPLYASSDTDRDLAALVFAKLIRYDPAGKPVMDLAERIEVNPDGRSYLVTLRPGVEWHDGEPLTADDVVFTIRTIQDPEYKSPLRPNWQGVTVERVDAAMVRFTLRQPYAPFLENLALGILPEHLWRKIPRDAAILSDLNLKPIGAGPYRFSKFTRREDGTITSVVLTRNPNYHLAGPYLKEIRFLFYATEVEIIAAYRRNEIDGFVFLARSPADELTTLDFRRYELELPTVFGVFLNTSNQPAFSRLKVRQALASAIDDERILRETVSTGGVGLATAIPPGTFGHNEALAATPFDPAKSKDLLAGDGWKDTDNNRVLERTEGTGRRRITTALEVELVTSDAPELARAAELIAEMWRAIGVKTSVKILPIADLEPTVIRPRAYQALLFGEAFGHDPDPFAFWHTSQLKDPGLNIAMYSNPAVDRLLEEARRTSDPERRSATYQEFQKIIAEEVGAIFLYRPTHFYAVRKSVRGIEIVSITLPEERFSGISQWYMETRRALK